MTLSLPGGPRLRPAVTAPAVPGTAEQVRAVLALRAATVRGAARRRAALGLAAVPLVALAAAVGGTLLPAGGQDDARILLPTALAGFALTCVIASATSGGRHLLPPGQAVAFPLTPAAEHAGAVLLAPLNLAWMVQAAGVLTLTAWAVGLRPGLLAAQVLVLVWLAVSTLAGQAAGWLVELIRTTRAGPWALRGLGAAAVAGTLLWTATDSVAEVLDALPTVGVVVAALQGADGQWAPWGTTIAVLLAAGTAAHVAGLFLAERLRRRPARAQARVETRQYPARPDARGELAAALRVDRAGVWRSAPLRRGLAALVAVPALAAVAAGLDWPLVALLPGLVASGAGLLFGVNAFSLDGAGALWRDTLPVRPRLLIGARLVVVAELCLVGALGAGLAGAVRAPAAPSVAELLAVVCAAVATTAQVVGRCAVWSVERPYPATLRDARDQPAPPAAMAGYSARLALSTTITGLVLSTLSRLGATEAILAVTAAVLALAARRIIATIRRWDDPVVRSRVLASVAGE